MGSGISKPLQLFKVAGVKIEIDYSWLIIFVLVLWSLSAGYFPQAYPGYTWVDYWMVGLAATLLFFASVLVHELSHAAVGNRLGERVDRITLFIFGGMARLSGEPGSAEREIKIAGVGPLTSLVLALFFWFISIALSPITSLWTAMFRYLAFINLALALFNLLPGYPLDGGRLLRETIGAKRQSVLANCPLWYSRYSTAPIGIPTASSSSSRPSSASSRTPCGSTLMPTPSSRTAGADS